MSLSAGSANGRRRRARECTIEINDRARRIGRSTPASRHLVRCSNRVARGFGREISTSIVAAARVHEQRGCDGRKSWRGGAARLAVALVRACGAERRTRATVTRVANGSRSDEP